MGPNQIKRGLPNSQLFDYRDRLSIPKNSFLSYLSNDYVFALYSYDDESQKWLK